MVKRMTDEAKALKRKRTASAIKDLKKNSKQSGVMGYDSTDFGNSLAKGRRNISKDNYKDRKLIDEYGTDAPKSRSYNTRGRSGKPLDELDSVTTEKVKKPGPGRRKNPLTGKSEPQLETITTKKKLFKDTERLAGNGNAKGGTVRMNSGGPVVDSYDY
tara:strand:+ start:6140 stop:6616 length:477 start_codon:yes stop_codon:yes gene_type:complete